ncbi:putative PEP-binding protein [Streptomyces seoulensis]|uniref:putative PEP-binding protein n=1 Tax=Streptomyces seoulensis TaxID=73044 RepID=UPI003D767269
MQGPAPEPAGPRPTFPFGVMVEVPACASAIHQFVERVDFLSIGTNYLAQHLGRLPLSPTTSTSWT